MRASDVTQRDDAGGDAGDGVEPPRRPDATTGDGEDGGVAADEYEHERLHRQGLDEARPGDDVLCIDLVP